MAFRVTLDGSTSIVADGTKQTYRWLSGTSAKPTGASGAGGATGEAGASVPAAGGSAADGVPDSSGRSAPPDEAMTTVMLGKGVWPFVLWVIDNEGAVSEPSTITIAPALDPMIKTCVDSAYPNETLS